MNTTLIIDNQYFPCVSYIKMLSTYKYVNLELYENYQKNSFRNRCVVAGSNGLINLSVPLLNGRDQKIPYRHLKIDNSQRWQVQHWRTITSCYQKSPFFEYYGPAIETLLNTHHELLFEFNYSILTWLKKTLKLSCILQTTSEYHVLYADPEITDARNKWQPQHYREEQGYAVSPYFQMFEDRIGFQPNLSILDLLFCAGPHTLS